MAVFFDVSYYFFEWFGFGRNPRVFIKNWQTYIVLVWHGHGKKGEVTHPAPALGGGRLDYITLYYV